MRARVGPEFLLDPSLEDVLEFQVLGVGKTHVSSVAAGLDVVGELLDVIEPGLRPFLECLRLVELCLGLGDLALCGSKRRARLVEFLDGRVPGGLGGIGAFAVGLLDRKSVVSGRSVSVRVDFGWRRISTKKIK